MTALSDDDWQLLSALPLFAELGDNRLRVLLGQARPRQLAQGAVLFLQGDPADRFFVVLEGWVKLARETAAGDETVVGIFARGEAFAEAAIFDTGTYPVNAEAVSPVRLLSIPAAPFIAALVEDPELAITMLASLSRHMRHLVGQLEQVQARSAPQRVASFLLRLWPGGAASGGAGPGTIELPYDKSLVAARLGMRPETFSRALSRLRGVGVTATGSQVTVPDHAALKRFCEDEPGS